MRVGSNPNKAGNSDVSFQPVVLMVVTHLPSLDGYHSKRMDVVQTCLQSMRAGAHRKHTFMVWDNGSCDMLRDWLRDVFMPDVLILSENVGKTTARTALARMVHPKSIICYSDDDMLFYDNWLDPQIDVLQHFPNVACVSGYPVRTSFRWGNNKTKEWARKAAKLENGRFLPDEWEDDFALSVGREIQWHRDYTRSDVDWLITFREKQAYATSHHCQFIGYAETIGKVLQYDRYAMGDERPFDDALDSVGLRLATVDRHCRHMGNVMDEKLVEESRRLLCLA